MEIVRRVRPAAGGPVRAVPRPWLRRARPPRGARPARSRPAPARRDPRRPAGAAARRPALVRRAAHRLPRPGHVPADRRCARRLARGPGRGDGYPDRAHRARRLLPGCRDDLRARPGRGGGGARRRSCRSRASSRRCRASSSTSAARRRSRSAMAPTTTSSRWRLLTTRGHGSTPRARPSSNASRRTPTRSIRPFSATRWHRGSLGCCRDAAGSCAAAGDVPDGCRLSGGPAQLCSPGTIGRPDEATRRPSNRKVTSTVSFLE